MLRTRLLVLLDLGGEVPDAVLNLADVQDEVFGFQGPGYPFSAPFGVSDELTAVLQHTRV